MSTARREVRSLFDLFNVVIRRDALDYLTEATQEKTAEDRKRYITNIIEHLRSELLVAQSLDLQTLKNSLQSSRKILADYHEDFHVINMPTDFYYRLNAKTNVLEMVPRNEVEELKTTNCMQRRMMNILSTLDLSHPLQQDIKPIESLFSSDQACRATILATARRVGGDSILAEDLTGCVPIEFSGTKIDGWLPFEGGCFLFEGQQMDGIFTVDDVHLPIPVSKEHLPKVDPESAFNRGKFKDCTDGDRIVVLSDVWLDMEKVFVSLNNLFIQLAENPPAMFIFCGCFHSSSVGINYLETEIENFQKLARLISNYAASFPDTKYVFVPSSEDLPATPIMPRFPFLPTIQKTMVNLKNVHFATNPCKILYKNRVISVVRDNVIEKISRSSLCAHSKTIEVVESFIDTIWSQRHMCPVLPSISPTISHHDDALLVQFDPDLLIAADKFSPFVHRPLTDQSSALTINPGSFGVNSMRAMVYLPKMQKAEFMQIQEP